MSNPNRNSPCPCGSGRKYKHCHGRPGAAVPDDEQVARRLQRTRDEAQRALRTWSSRHLDQAHIEGAASAFTGASGMGLYDPETDEVNTLFLAWMDLFSVSEGDPESYPDPRTAVGGLLARGRITPSQRRFLEASAREPFTLWTVEEVGSGPWLRMRDRILEREVRLHNLELAAIARPGMSIYGQFVEQDGVAVLAAADDAVLFTEGIGPFTAFREAIGAEGMEPVDLLPYDLEMLELYGKFLEDLEEDDLELEDEPEWDTLQEQMGGSPIPPGAMPTMQTTTGDPIEPSTLRFRLAEGRRDDVAALLDEAPDFDLDRAAEADGTLPAVWFGRGGTATMGATLHAILRLDGWGLTAEVMSQARATALRERLEELGAGRLVFERAEVLSFEEAMRRHQAAVGDAPPPAGLDPEDLPEEVLSHLRQRFLAWADDSVPALDGLTPRAAVKDPTYRARVIELVDDWERMGGGQPPLPGADFDELRAELGLGEV